MKPLDDQPAGEPVEDLSLRKPHHVRVVPHHSATLIFRDLNAVIETVFGLDLHKYVVRISLRRHFKAVVVHVRGLLRVEVAKPQINDAPRLDPQNWRYVVAVVDRRDKLKISNLVALLGDRKLDVELFSPNDLGRRLKRFTAR